MKKSEAWDSSWPQDSRLFCLCHALGVKRGVFLLFFVWVFALWQIGAGVAQAEAPPHDEYVNAIAVALGMLYNGTTIGATGVDETSCGSSDSRDVWHSFTPSSSGEFLLMLCGSGFDTTLAVFDGPGGVEVACNDDSCGVQSEISLNMTADHTYIVRVAGYGGDMGSYILTIIGGVSTLPNDGVADAIAIVEGTPYNGTTVGARGADESSCAYGDSRDVWHSFTPSSSGEFLLSLCGSGFDTTLAVFDGPGGVEVACNDDSCGLQSEVILNMTADNTYLVRVAGSWGDMGNYELTVTREVCELPEQPINPEPADGAVDTGIDAILSWNDGVVGESGGVILPKLIFGADDRLEEYEVTDPRLRTVGDSTAVMVSRTDLRDNGDGTFTLPSETIAEYYQSVTGRTLCQDEPYRDQPSVGWCSGFLVAGDMIATAGHCIESASDCGAFAFVFGFVMSDEVTPVLTVDASQVYLCSEIVRREFSGENDWGLIRLDRSVDDHVPLAVRRSGTVATGEELVIIGHPVGIPRKYAAGATVRENSHPSYFQANLDAYGGNSGSAVFNASTYEVEGILVRGYWDFVPDGSCDRSYVCPDSGCPDWEDVTRSTVFGHMIPSFDVYLGTDENELQPICTETVVSWCDPGELLEKVTYYWQVVAKNRCGERHSPVWSFTTESLGDPDGDDVWYDQDNCPFVANPGQEDGEGDGVGDVCDNCPNDENGDQTDTDGDQAGDVCDGDDDNDGTPDDQDGCSLDAAKTEPGICGCGLPDSETDGDGIADCFDNCPDASNLDQADTRRSQ